MSSQRELDAPRIIVCVGMVGSASTWLFNVVRSIESTVRSEPVRSAYVDTVTYEMLPDIVHAGASSIVIKSHVPSPSLLAAIYFGRIPALLTIRDPRDATASLMTRFGTQFEEAAARVFASAAALVHLAHIATPLTLRYEDGFFDNWQTVSHIASFIASPLQDEQARAIADSLSRDNVRQFVEAKIREGALSTETPSRSFDGTTHWHPYHVGDGKVGKFADILTEAQIAQVDRETRPFRERFYRNGYSDPGG